MGDCGNMKILQILFIKCFLQYVFAIQIQQNSELLPPICYEKSGGVVVAMKNSCTGYFICHNGRVVVGSCGDYYRFNADKGICDHPDNVLCTPWLQQDKKLSKEQQEMYDAAVKKSKQSTGERSSSQSFPKPIHPREVNADDSAGEICKQKPDGTFLTKKDSCTEYYVCYLQRPYRRTCPHQQHFNDRELQCQDPSLASCTLELPNDTDNSESLDVQEFDKSLEDEIHNEGLHIAPGCTDSPNGSLLPHAKVCEKFIFCLLGKPLELQCPRGKHFSTQHLRCEWPWLANCKVWKIPGDD